MQVSHLKTGIVWRTRQLVIGSRSPSCHHQPPSQIFLLKPSSSRIFFGLANKVKLTDAQCKSYVWTENNKDCYCSSHLFSAIHRNVVQIEMYKYRYTKFPAFCQTQFTVLYLDLSVQLKMLKLVCNFQPEILSLCVFLAQPKTAINLVKPAGRLEKNLAGGLIGSISIVLTIAIKSEFGLLEKQQKV